MLDNLQTMAEQLSPLESPQAEVRFNGVEIDQIYEQHVDLIAEMSAELEHERSLEGDCEALASDVEKMEKALQSLHTKQLSAENEQKECERISGTV